MAYERKRITLKEVPALIAFLDMCGIAHRGGKGSFQVLQIQFPKGWGAICKNANDDLSSAPELSGIISAFRAAHDAKPSEPSPAPAPAPEPVAVAAPVPRGGDLSPITAKSIGMGSLAFMALLEDFAIQVAPTMIAAVLAAPDSDEMGAGKAGDMAAMMTYRVASKMVAEHAKYAKREGC